MTLGHSMAIIKNLMALVPSDYLKDLSVFADGFEKGAEHWSDERRAKFEDLSAKDFVDGIADWLGIPIGVPKTAYEARFGVSFVDRQTDEQRWEPMAIGFDPRAGGPSKEDCLKAFKRAFQGIWYPKKEPEIVYVTVVKVTWAPIGGKIRRVEEEWQRKEE